jgi:kumamolisin
MCYQATSQQSSPDLSTSVIDPGAQPFATAVGGTSLCQSSADGCAVVDDGSYPGESVWNDGLEQDPTSGVLNASATGGGVSDQWPMPSYQSGAAASLDVISPESSKACGNQFCREVPDVAADADPATGYAIYANGGATGGGWGITAGTSAAAPLWAAYTALLNASPTCRGFTLGFENPALYQLAGSSYLSVFHDITAASPSTGQASNNPFFDYTNSDNPNGLYPVGAGYDMATGLGTPIANTLGPALCSLRAPVYAVTVTSPGTQTSIINKPVSLQVPAGDPGAGTTLTDSATGLPAGLSMSPSGLITGTPTADGTSTVTVTATDQFTNTANTSFAWTVVTPGPPLTLEHLAGLKNGKISLALNVTAGSYAPAITSVKLVLPKGLAFVRKAKLLKKAIKVSSGAATVAFTFSGHGGSLTLRFTTPQLALVAIRISKAAFAETTSLEKKVRKHKTKRVKVSVLVTDAAGLATPFKAVIKL